MTLEEISSHFAYNRWANERTLAAAATLSPEAVARPLGSSFPSIRDTIAHIAGGEWVWLKRWTGESPTSFPDWMPGSDLEALGSRLAAIDRERGAYLLTLTDADLDRRHAFKLLNGQADEQPLIFQMLHIVNHSTYHRGQVAGMMRQVGAVPVSTDFIAYKRLQVV